MKTEEETIYLYIKYKWYFNNTINLSLHETYLFMT